MTSVSSSESVIQTGALRSNTGMSFADLYARHALASFDKQVYLEAMLGRKRWSFDAQRGTLIFEDAHDQELELAVQVLGTESDEDASWLWAWANPAAGLPARMLAAALELKALGEREGIPEISRAEVPFGHGVDAGRIAAVASGVCRAGCFYRAPYPGGAIFMLIKDAKFRRFVTRPLPRIKRILPMFLSDTPVEDARGFYLHYLAFYRLTVKVDGPRVTATLGSAEPLVAVFDPPGHRLLSISGGDSPPSKLDLLRP